MCIPDEYFIDGDRDCMDSSDERIHVEDTVCPSLPPSYECDDRLCLPCIQKCRAGNVCIRGCWSCGDGQCVLNRIDFFPRSSTNWFCINRRDQFFFCEVDGQEGLWTLDNGRCTENKPFNEQNIDEYCHYLRICELSGNKKHNCTCRYDGDNCSELFRQSCSTWNMTHYPNGGLFTPYIFGYYDQIFQSSFMDARWKVSGTIKCRGYLGKFLFHADGRYIGYYLHDQGYICTSRSHISYVMDKGYDRFCHNDSRTFNNLSYHFIDVCNSTESCISAYRINDGFYNCGFDDEQSANELVNRSCANVRQHRFRCSINQSTCFYAILLGVSGAVCDNGHDKYWLDTSILLSNINCNGKSKTGCSTLRRYIEASWNSTLLKHDDLQSSSMKKLSFRAYCDIYPDLLSKEDEDAESCASSWVCLREQWQCPSGQCIPFKSVLNSVYDCPDASDEQSFFASALHPFNYINYGPFIANAFKFKFDLVYPASKLWSVCQFTGKSPCSSNNRFNYRSVTKHCINLTALGNHKIGCPSNCDEPSIIDHCYLSLRALGYEVQCLSMIMCLGFSHRFQHTCTNSSHSPLPCHMTDSNLSGVIPNEFFCWNGSRTWERCNKKADCSNSEDEYMCGRSDSSTSLAERKNKFDFQTTQKWLHLLRFPANVSTNEYKRSIPKIESNPEQLPIDYSQQHDRSIFNWCNRGIPIRLNNASIVCFCSPHYHGDQCQYHTDRISFLLHVNFTYSKYTSTSDTSIINIYLVLFLYNDLVLSTNEFHLRPTDELDYQKKKRIYLHYSHSNQSIEYKRQRYFNRSNIIDHHPYAIRIEAFELKLNKKPQRFAIWQYPIYFDFLPVYRFAKVLRFFDSRKISRNPCQNNPCNSNEECHQLQNQPSNYKCLCKSHYSGPNCSKVNQLCSKNYCSSNALCQPSYRGLTQGNHWPYWICPLNYIGQRCKLKPNACDANPCANNASCYQMLVPNQFMCKCTDEYLGEKCEEKKRFIHFHIEEKSPLDYHGSAVQYFVIDFVQLELRLAHQDVYTTLPSQLRYFHDDKIVPEITFLQLHTLNNQQIYLLAVQLNRTTLIANVSIQEDNRCQHIRSFSSPNESISIIRYHSLCQNNSRILCFHDDQYLCICNEKNLGVECFLHQHEHRKCDECKANAQCLKGSKKGIVCICPLCHSGDRCQFSFESFSFTLDQLFFSDLQSPSSTIKYTTLFSLVCIPVLLFLVGIINNLCCFITFRRKKCRHNGIGEYLLLMSVINQLNLTFLVIRFLHMTANTFNPYSFPTFDTIFCKLVNYCLLTSTRITYWLSSLIAIERLYVVVFLSGRWLKNPYIARRISFAIVATIFLLSAYELAFIKSEISGGDGSVAVCVMIFPVDDPTWKDLHNSVVIIDSLTPFLIDLISTIDIICIVTKKKMNANAPSVSVSMIKVIAVKDRRFPNVQQTLPTEQAGLNGVGLVAENDQISPKVVTVS
ncbi:unnamed protein product, partial [Rotaria magnacalcarata]